MSVTAAFMLPHPPLIVPEIGKGSEKEVTDTIDAYRKVAREIASIKPDTIIITSPHQVMYSDYFHISPGDRASGSFWRFGCPEVKFSEEYDRELVDRICLLADKEDFPAGTRGEKDPALDHGCMVPLYYIRKEYTGGKIIRIGLSGLSLAMHYRLGQLIAEATSCNDKKVVFVASGDLSHKLQSYGPYGFAPEGPEYDKRIMDVCGRGAFGELFEFDEDFCEKASECGHRSFVIMAGALDGLSVDAKALSHEDVTGVGYGICSFIPGADDREREFLRIYMEQMQRKCRDKAAMSDEYVNLARMSVESWVREKKRLNVPEGLPEDMLTGRAGAFVSIHEHGRLRGCIGTIMATTSSIADEIIDNAISACSRDPRFSPVEEKELDYLDISVDILGETEDIESAEELDPRRYGVIVSCGHKRGLLLPNLCGVDTVEDQIRIAMQKGGIYEYEEYKLQRFEVVRHY